MNTPLALSWRPFRFDLPAALVTAHGALEQRRGWLLRLQDRQGRLGWGEAAPLAVAAPRLTTPPRPNAAEASCLRRCHAAITALGEQRTAAELEAALPLLPQPVAFALGAAIAELQGLVGEACGGWLAAPPSAWLLPAGEAALPALEAVLATAGISPPGRGSPADATDPDAAAAPLEGTRTAASLDLPARRGPGRGRIPLTLKWKVAAGDDLHERRLLETLLERLPAGGRLRLDANGGWDRPTAGAWADRLLAEPRLEWLEQPLPPGDHKGLLELARRLPVALDESLRADPSLAETWPGWLVHRPALAGDPRPLLAALRDGRPRWMVSTAFETGIARRWLEHLAALQAAGPTPAAPGLAPGWTPRGPLFAADPQRVWASLAAEQP